jgi:soluble lytic murein transglycosylase
VTAVVAATLICYSLARARLFPARYRGPLKEAAEEFGLDPLLVAAVVHCESGFRPDARSPAGARGLMQLMPATAQEAASKVGLDGYTDGALEDPRTNLRLGCAHLRRLLDQFGGDERLALAAYNAGQGNVARWLEQVEGDRDRMLEEEAFPETRRYVRRVLGARRWLERFDSMQSF